MSDTPLFEEQPVAAHEHPDVHDAEKKPVSLGFQLLLSAANIAIWLAIIPPPTTFAYFTGYRD